jgi:DNA-binding transcriptional ArsR family regulator
MSIRMMTQFWDNGDPELSGSRLVLMLCLADHANDNGECFPSITRLAERSRLHRQNVMVHLKELEALGYITVKRVEGRHNSYILHPTRNETVTGTASATRNETVTGTGNDTVTGPVTPPLPEPSINRQLNHQEQISETALSLFPPEPDATPALAKTGKVKKAKPKSDAPRIPTAQQEMMNALAHVCQLDLKIPNVASYCGKVASGFVKAEYIPDIVMFLGDVMWPEDSFYKEKPHVLSLKEVETRIYPAKLAYEAKFGSNGKNHNTAPPAPQREPTWAGKDRVRRAAMGQDER